MSQYLSRLVAGVASTWNQFWFTPADPYPLGVIRLLVGAIALYLHLTLTLDLTTFFAADGLLPVDSVRELEQLYYEGTQEFSYGTASYLNWFSTPGELLAVHGVGSLALVAMTLGWWSRWSVPLALVVLLADVHRAPFLTSGCETMLTMAMAYLCLGPSGASWSLDARRAAQRTPAARPAASIAANLSLRLIQVHLALLVAVMGFSKLIGDTETWWRGTGVWWLIARPESRLIDLTWLHSHRYLVNLWTHAVVALELSFPILIWVPLLRPLLIVLGGLVWLSLAVVTGDLPFAAALLATMLAFIPGAALRSCCRSANG